MKPLIYGYLRITDDLDDDEVRQMERGLKKLAEAEGFRLGTIYYEDVPSCQDAFNDLRRELKRAQAHHVVTPSLDHLSHHRILQDRMVILLECGANARISVVEQ
ncbi:MAG: recombinase family protein [Pseudonocardiaceae bacterium]